jgi:hypothetical protein
MGFRLDVSEAPDLTTIRVVGRLRNEGVALLGDACQAAHRPVVLDLSDLTGASEAGVLLLGRLQREGIHLLGVSPYVRILLERSVVPHSAPPVRRRRSG